MKIEFTFTEREKMDKRAAEVTKQVNEIKERAKD